jgi:hypothetical protein
MELRVLLVLDVGTRPPRTTDADAYRRIVDAPQTHPRPASTVCVDTHPSDVRHDAAGQPPRADLALCSLNRRATVRQPHVRCRLLF